MFQVAAFEVSLIHTISPQYHIYSFIYFFLTSNMNCTCVWYGSECHGNVSIFLSNRLFTYFTYTSANCTWKISLFWFSVWETFILEWNVNRESEGEYERYLVTWNIPLLKKCFYYYFVCFVLVFLNKRCIAAKC